MKNLLLTLLFFLVFTNGFSQILDPVKWKFKTEKISETEFNLVLEGTIDSGWHVYSQFTPDGGPIPFELKFAESVGNYELVGKTKESKTRKEYNPVFEVDEVFFENKIVLTQKVKIVNSKTRNIKLKIDYQACKEVCINLNKKFVFKISSITENTIISDNNDVILVDSNSTVTSNKTEITTQEPTTQEPKKEDKKGLFTIFIIAFFSGFAALLTPCVFPMIPMTVSFFTKQSKNKAQGIRNAIIYGISIILIYVVLGLLVTWIFGADALNALSTNVWFNILFFGLLVFFAASFLGAFEIMLPNSWANKVDQQADRGGILGILFMALALALSLIHISEPTRPY